MLLAILAVTGAATLSTYTLAITDFLLCLGSRTPSQAPLLTPRLGFLATPEATPDPLRTFAAVPGEAPLFNK